MFNLSNKTTRTSQMKSQEEKKGSFYRCLTTWGAKKLHNNAALIIKKF